MVSRSIAIPTTKIKSSVCLLDLLEPIQRGRVPVLSLKALGLQPVRLFLALSERGEFCC